MSATTSSTSAVSTTSLILNTWSKKYILIILTPVKRTFVKDAIFEQKIMHEAQDEVFINGATAAQPVKPYMVTIDNVGLV